MNIIDLVVWEQIKKQEEESAWQPEPLYDYAPESVEETEKPIANEFEF